MADQDGERWTKLVADFESSELTQREFACERGISFSNLRNWIYKLRKESRPVLEVALASSGQAPAQAGPKERSRLVPVRVVTSAPKARRDAVAAAGSDGLLELVFASGARLRFPAGTDLAYLRALAAAL